jgi:hypothetical protein
MVAQRMERRHLSEAGKAVEMPLVGVPALLADLHIETANYDELHEAWRREVSGKMYSSRPALGRARSDRPDEPPARQACKNCEDRGDGECSTKAGCYAGVYRAPEGHSNRI